ncbi:MAG: hypothetical protein WCK47_09140 [bacterium]|nr:hypothetical protein [Candidatus Sumerlaeota bacterium]
MKRFIKTIPIALAAALCFGAAPSNAVVVHISKSFPMGYSEITPGSFEFQASSPIYIDDALAWGGYAGYTTNLVDGMSQVIIEDSTTYNLVADKALDPTQTYASINCDGFGAAGAGGLRVYALAGQTPGIDYTGTTHMWGGGACGFFFTNVADKPLSFKMEGLNIICTNTGGVNWGDAFVMLGPGCNVPEFKDCIFQLEKSMGCGAGGGDINIHAPTGNTFDHCAFWLTPAASDIAVILKPSANYWLGNTVFSHCTFIINPTATPSHWSAGWGNEKVAFDKCLFYYMDTPSRYGGVQFYTNNCDWPAMSGKPSGAGNITQDPLLVDPANSFLVQKTSPCVDALGVPANNIGYDIWTTPPSSAVTDWAMLE